MPPSAVGLHCIDGSGAWLGLLALCAVQPASSNVLELVLPEGLPRSLCPVPHPGVVVPSWSADKRHGAVLFWRTCFE